MKVRLQGHIYNHRTSLRTAARATQTATPVEDTLELSAPARPRIEKTAQQTALAAAKGALFGFGGCLLPDTGGRISHLALQFGNREFDGPLPETARKAVLNVYKTLFDNMDPRTKFTIVAADERGVRDLKEMFGDSHRVRVVKADTDKGFSIWIRDSMLPVRDEDGNTKVIVQDRSYFAGPDEQNAPFRLGLKAERHPSLRLDGGNILNNGRRAFVGIDSIQHTRERLQELDPKAVDQLLKLTGTDMDELPRLLIENEVGKSVTVVAGDDPNTPIREEQPAFHIDMVATPIGDEEFLVGDPGLAIQTLQNLSPQERREVNLAMTRAAALPQDQDLIGKLIEQNAGPENQANYGNLARQLSEDHEVERIPCLMGQRYGHDLPYLTYNNCMMEDYLNEAGERIRKVYLPQYGCEPLDKMARQAYEQRGFQVVPLDMAAITVLAGAIRCSSYALERV